MIESELYDVVDWKIGIGISKSRREIREINECMRPGAGVKTDRPRLWSFLYEESEEERKPVRGRGERRRRRVEGESGGEEEEKRRRRASSKHEGH